MKGSNSDSCYRKVTYAAGGNLIRKYILAISHLPLHTHLLPFHAPGLYQQAALSSGFWVGLAHSKQEREMGGQRREKSGYLLPSCLPAMASECRWLCSLPQPQLLPSDLSPSPGSLSRLYSNCPLQLQAPKAPHCASLGVLLHPLLVYLNPAKDLCKQGLLKYPGQCETGRSSPDPEDCGWSSGNHPGASDGVRQQEKVNGFQRYLGDKNNRQRGEREEKEGEIATLRKRYSKG